MDFTNRPITEFYRHCLLAARNKGYRWVVTLLAREADVDGLYSNLYRAWSSLDSIFGRNIQPPTPFLPLCTFCQIVSKAILLDTGEGGIRTSCNSYRFRINAIRSVHYERRCALQC